MIEFNTVKEKTLTKRNLGTIGFEVVLLLGSAFVLALSFPSFCSKDGWGFLAFFALIPLFYVVRNTTWKTVGFYGFFYGYVFYWIFNFWLSAFHPLANVLVQVIKGTEMILLFFALKAADRWFSEKFSFVIQAVFFTAYYYLAQSWFAGYPYGTIAYALFKYRLLIQIVDLVGIWGLCFILVLPQAFLGRWVCDYFSRTTCQTADGLWISIKKSKISLLIWCLLFLFQIVYGIFSLSYWSKAEEDKSFTVATVQHNADSWKGGYSTYEKNYLNLKKMSLEAMQKSPDMVIWSETAFVPSVNWYTKYPYKGNKSGGNFDYLKSIQVLVDDFVDFGKNLGVPLLTGNPSSVLGEGTVEPYTQDGDWNNKKDYNSVILFDEGQIKQTYLKQHLVPFTEHFPYEKQLPALYNILKANDYHWWEKGFESVVFETSNGITFSTPICFEDIFGYLNADFVNAGADLLINMTNDSWSGSIASERQHMAMAVFRAIENRRTMLRGTNSGITCLITPDGKIQDEMEPFKMGWKIWDVPVFSSDTYGKTLYTRTSDLCAHVLVWFSYAILAAGAFFAVFKKVGGKKNK